MGELSRGLPRRNFGLLVALLLAIAGGGVGGRAVVSSPTRIGPM